MFAAQSLVPRILLEVVSWNRRAHECVSDLKLFDTSVCMQFSEYVIFGSGFGTGGGHCCQLLYHLCQQIYDPY